MSVLSRRIRPVRLALATLTVVLIAYAAVVASNSSLIPGLGPQVGGGEGAGGFDAADTRKLVGISTGVFVGRVVGQESAVGLPTSAPGTSIPMRQFRVQVLENIKGTLKGVIIVNQYEGVEGDPPLAKGRTYVLAVEPAALFTPSGKPIGRGWYQIVAPRYGDVLVDNAAHRAKVVAAFKQAHKNEIPFDRATGSFIENTR